MFHVLRKHGISAQVDETIVAGFFDLSKVEFVLDADFSSIADDISHERSDSINIISDTSNIRQTLLLSQSILDEE